MTGLAITNLHASYGRNTVLKGVTLDTPFAEATLTAVLGQNGAGKSTFLRALAGLQRCSGTLALDGTDLDSLSAPSRATRITYMPQTLPGNVALTVLEAVIGALRATGDSTNAIERAQETLDRLGITHLGMKSLDSLSGGQRQLASLAQAIARSPRVLLLDEPTSALDIAHQLRVMKVLQAIIRERNIIAVAVIHDLTLAARWCDRLTLLADGKVVADGAPQKALSPESLARVYGVSARVELCSRGTAQVIVDDLLIA